jgi:hypothetical protein
MSVSSFTPAPLRRTGPFDPSHGFRHGGCYCWRTPALPSVGRPGKHPRENVPTEPYPYPHSFGVCGSNQSTLRPPASVLYTLPRIAYSHAYGRHCRAAVAGPRERVTVVQLTDLNPADVMSCLLIVGPRRHSGTQPTRENRVVTPRRHPS